MDYLSLCLTCKDENDYLPEWLDYHILMGVDRFYIYDNESQISLRESLKEYVERGWVVVVDIPGKGIQGYAYEHCLQNFGPSTFWLGFIDTDEFLVPKTGQDLKELLKGYEACGGLAVSSLFFGSSAHQIRPTSGQIAAYTWHTHKTFKENELVKSIIQPSLVLIPNSPHDFIFKEGSWCVNEGFLRVDFQRFPNNIEKIQLNHYFCRSECEIDLKLRRGNSGDIVWSRRFFNVVNQLAKYEDTCILQNLEALFHKECIDSRCLADAPQSAGILERMAILARARRPALLEKDPPREASRVQAEFYCMEELKSQIRSAIDRKEFAEAKRLALLRLQKAPQNILLYVELVFVLIDLSDWDAAWQALTQAWQISPNNYIVLGGMVIYFLRVEHFSMAEKTCYLMLDLAPHDTVALGLLANSLIGQGRFEEGLKVGVPVVELAGQFGELPYRMGVSLVKQMADYLLEKKDYAGAIRLWEAGVKCEPGDVDALLELSHALLLAGDKTQALQRLTQARQLDPRNEAVLTLLRTDALAHLSVPNGKKRRH
ncbi:MAG: glycosyltransferase family 92 protein [Chloroflexi bacterium]|nr:glycosyltransferase family 92 protein [Chloroflexota bacterium]